MTDPTPRREATRKRLIQAGIREFAARGIDATSVEQISEAAGFTRGAFYSNFEDKDELILAIVEDVHTATSALFREAVEQLPGGVQLEEAVALVLQSRMVSPEVHTTMLEITLRSHRDPKLQERLGERRCELTPLFREVLTAAADRLGLRLTVEVADFIDIIDALYESTFVLSTGGGEARMIYLTGLIASRFTEPAPR
ncbi:TetR/AcrR family transcriptional regulator [Tessaracoccus caeni]|uniref:TetR/AcrR family transcriptional regulator n=1 Tax=Tessaracoccus caeni TaxID=3031239 RepID=UPI0023DBEF73|nr:TetR/AcrR family transcriptional regulator [Tessaracoccus caeni]MDF1487495.1 TetR/AcrR family transcriptional regulator [Tessaracoccus caeni]